MKNRQRNILILTAISLIVISILSLMFGTHIISFNELIAALFQEDAKYHWIVWEYRVPRLCIGALVGASLAVAGTIFQGVLKNPLASTDVLGMTKGAGFMAALVLTIPMLQHIPVSISALLGGLLVAVILFLLTRKSGFKNSNVIVMGIALSAMFDAGIQYLTLNTSGNVQTAFTWLIGSLWGKYWDELLMMLPFVLICFPIVLGLSKRLDILGLSDEIVIGLGENILRTKIILLLMGVLLTAISVSVAGTISFIGLMAPHIAKSLVGHRHSILILTSGMVGALLIVIADTVGRTLFSPIEIPVGIVTAIIGAPYFIYLLLNKNQLKQRGL
ncbi:MAG TPA: iron-dicitrate transporter subunit FecD [Firmicutes bacterium]|nr:iron-dicitrate transporter subunit FecD [Bacillota bacterium]